MSSSVYDKMTERSLDFHGIVCSIAYLEILYVKFGDKL